MELRDDRHPPRPEQVSPEGARPRAARRKHEDIFPTVYRCNTARQLRRQLERNGMDAVVVPYESEPAYLSFSRSLYALGVLHQRYAPRLLRRTLMALGTKRHTELEV